MSSFAFRVAGLGLWVEGLGFGALGLYPLSFSHPIVPLK